MAKTMTIKWGPTPLREDDAHIGGFLVKNRDLAGVASQLNTAWLDDDGPGWNDALKALAKLLRTGVAMTLREREQETDRTDHEGWEPVESEA